MGTRKSQRNDDVLTDFVVRLYEKLLEDFQQLLPDEKKTFERDKLTLVSRVAKEGISFLTKTLPKFGKAFDSSLDTGRLGAVLGLKKSKSHPAIPALLQGMLKRVFFPDGTIRPDADPLCVRHIRQFCYLAYKLELPYSLAQEEEVINSFLENERELLALEIHDSPVLDEARRLLELVFRGFDPKDIKPRHGPGAVATGEKLEQKWEFSRLYSGIHRKYPYYDYYVVGGSREILDRVQWYKNLERLDVGEAKVVLVPKDSRGPRLISCEPLEYQWIQQGLDRALRRHLESHWLTRGQVNFSDQSVNRQIALESSTHHAFATLDLKDASDRVSVQLIEKIFPMEMIPFLLAVRSHATRLPDNRVVALAKYAPMGSATCFSVEATCFWAICAAAVSTHRGSRAEACSSVYVYGDDIIVPTTCFEIVVEALNSVGLKVNESKSFYRGDFRESCGMDAFKGVNVTPTRIKTLWSHQSSCGEVLCSYSAYANDFARKDYYGAEEFVWTQLAEVFGKYPYGLSTSGYPNRNLDSVGEVGRQNAANGIRTRVNPNTQSLEVFCSFVKSKSRKTTLDGWARLARFFLQGIGDSPDEVVLPRSTQIRRGWRRV